MDKLLGIPKAQADSLREVYTAVLLILLLLVLGTLGYEVIEGWSFLDSVYMTVITLTTVGYREIHELSTTGQIFTMLLVMAGVGNAFYCFTVIARSVIQGELGRYRSLRKMQKRISTMNNHTIVCGFGRLARIVVSELVEAKQDVVVLELDPAVLPEIESCGAPYVEGSAYEDEVLREAGIERAKTLLALLPEDSDNVYVSLCARDLNPNLNILARSEGAGESKLRRAGANQVLAPYQLSGARIVQQIIRPNVSDFLEVAAGTHGGKLVLEEVRVPENSPLNGRTLEESELRKKTGAIIAAFIDVKGQMLFNPGGTSIIEPGSTMIVLGVPGSVDSLSSLLAGPQR